jgi:hypothetical protein
MVIIVIIVIIITPGTLLPECITNIALWGIALWACLACLKHTCTGFDIHKA